MLKTIVTLLFVACCVVGESTPKLWGSRVVTQKNGQATLKFEYEKEFAKFHIETYRGGNKVDTIKIENDKCLLTATDVEWGSPCGYDPNQKLTVITVKEVTAQDELQIRAELPPDNKVIHISVVFAPDGKYPTPVADGAIVKESAPLSRFVQGQKNVPLTFAVEGSTSTSTSAVQIIRNDKLLCQWMGAAIDTTVTCDVTLGPWAALTVDTANNMRILKKDFPLPTDADGKDAYAWATSSGILSITVDGKQSDSAPVVTTSFAVMHMIEVKLFLILALLYLGR